MGCPIFEHTYILECEPDTAYDRVMKRDTEFIYRVPTRNDFSTYREAYRRLLSIHPHIKILNTENQNAADQIINDMGMT